MGKVHRPRFDPDREDAPDIDYVYRAAKYVDKAFRLFDDKTGVKIGLPSTLDLFVTGIESFAKKQSAESNTE